MKKVESNKQQKKSALFSTAFRLFTDKGFAKTTISDIAAESGLAKGTFYLYFKDKYDLRDKLIVRKACQLITEARTAVEADLPDAFEDQFLAIVDYLLRKFEEDPALLKFIAKNLSWGVFRSTYMSVSTEESLDFYDFFVEKLQKAGYTCPQPELLLYSIIELVSSTCYSCILHKQPVDMETYLPYLHRMILAIFGVYVGRDN